MNLVLLLPEDWTGPGRVRLEGRRWRHVCEVLGTALGEDLSVGCLDGPIGWGRVSRRGEGFLELDVEASQPPPAKHPVQLVLALPRPKVLNRVLASATSLGIEAIHLVNAWKVEKSYWKSPRLAPENLLQQRLLGLEQARDTILPTLHLHRLFRPFAEEVLPGLVQGRTALAAHPGAPDACPRDLGGPALLAVGPEGGWIDAELDSLQVAGVRTVDLGPRILRVETAVAALMGRLF